MIIIGIDCATDPAKVGIARGRCGARTASLTDVGLGENYDQLVGTIVNWLPAKSPGLLALDAPLGWPSSLGRALVGHHAGAPVGDSPDLLFRRRTDRFVKREIGKQPIDVGADRIARTAHAALKLLADVRIRSRQKIPLAWTPSRLRRPAAIEVYPAGTLMAHGLPNTEYKGSPGKAMRLQIVRGLKRRRLEISPAAAGLLSSNSDALDAAVCVLAGWDFIRGRALPPGDLFEAKREGWIWVAPRGT